MEFNRIPRENRLSNRPDLHAFLLLDRLVPGSRDIVSGSGYEVIYLATDVKKLARVITEEQIIDLLRCGISYDEQKRLYSFV